MAPDFACQRAQVGHFALTLVRDSVYLVDGGALFGVVPKTLWWYFDPDIAFTRIAQDPKTKFAVSQTTP